MSSVAPDREPVALFHAFPFSDTVGCPNPDTCGQPHTYADIKPDPPAIRHTIALPDTYAIADTAPDSAAERY